MNSPIKKKIYVLLFVFLGLVLQGLVHEFIEIWYIDLLVKNFHLYGLGLTWQDWFVLHRLLTIILVVLGLIFGLWQGKFWWKKLYENK